MDREIEIKLEITKDEYDKLLSYLLKNAVSVVRQN